MQFSNVLTAHLLLRNMLQKSIAVLLIAKQIPKTLSRHAGAPTNQPNYLISMTPLLPPASYSK